MKTITTTQLAQMLKELKGVTFASILYFVDESLSRTVKKEKLVKKLTFTPVTLGSNYTNKIYSILQKKQGAGEDFEFEAKKMSGRTLLAPTLVQTDKTGVLAIYGIVENHAKNAIRSKMFFDGKMYDRKELEKKHNELVEAGEAGIFTPSYFKDTATKGQGTVNKENEFGIITTKLDNIRKIKIKGEVYKIV